MIGCAPFGGVAARSALRMAAARRLDGGVQRPRPMSTPLARQRRRRVAAGERLQRVEHATSSLCSRATSSRMARRSRFRHRRVAPHRVEVRAHRGERRAHLVPDVRGEPARRLERALRLAPRSARAAPSISFTLRAPARRPRGRRSPSGSRRERSRVRGHAGDRAAQPRQRRSAGPASRLASSTVRPIAERRDQRDARAHRVDAVLERAGVGAELEQRLRSSPPNPGGARQLDRQRPPLAAARVDRSRSPARRSVGKPSSGRRPRRAARARSRSRARRTRSRRAARAAPVRSPAPGTARRRPVEAAGRPAPSAPARPAGPCARRSSSRSRLDRSRLANVATVATPPAISTSATAAVAAAVTRALMLSVLSAVHARRTNPTPRTVWIIRGSPSASSLRRR